MRRFATKNFTNFLTGAAQSSNVLESTFNGHNDADRYYRTNEIASYAQDKWQLQPNLSITLGLRYDYHGGLTEKYGNLFNFDPSAYNVVGTVATGFTVNNAGFVVAGNNKQDPTAGTSDSTLSGRQWGFSPRIGFAWQPKRDNGKVVINGGAGDLLRSRRAVHVSFAARGQWQRRTVRGDRVFPAFRRM